MMQAFLQRGLMQGARTCLSMRQFSTVTPMLQSQLFYTQPALQMPSPLREVALEDAADEWEDCASPIWCI